MGCERSHSYPAFAVFRCRGQCRVVGGGCGVSSGIEALERCRCESGGGESVGIQFQLCAQRKQELGIAAGEAFACAPRLFQSHAAHTAEPQQGRHEVRAEHVVQIDEHIGAPVGDDARTKTGDSSGAGILFPEVHAGEPEVGGRIHENARHCRTRKQLEFYSGIGHAGTV